MSLRDREVLDLLRDEPELLAIADAVSDTENGPRQLRPFRAVGAGRPSASRTASTSCRSVLSPGA
jgi:hypothetical protein